MYVTSIRSVLAGLVLSPLIAMVVFTHSFLQGEKAGMMAGVITTAAIYQKVYSCHCGCAKTIATLAVCASIIAIATRPACS